MYFWVSWYQPTEDYRPLTYPPNKNILGWWCSGHGYDKEGNDLPILCAMIKAKNDYSAFKSVKKDWPEIEEWRFCNEVFDLDLSDRFPLKEGDWATERFDKERKLINESNA